MTKRGAMTGKEIGYQKLPSWSDLVTDEGEKNPSLRWPYSIDVYDQMRREDAQVGSVLRAVTTPIRSAQWTVDPAGSRPEVAEFVAQNFALPLKGQTDPPHGRIKGRFSWEDHVRLALLEIVFGHSFFEQVYRPESNHLWLHKLAWRPPRTISEIKVARDGGLVSIVQNSITSGDGKAEIPVSRLVAYVNEREGANWFGQSLLRGCYKNWLLKDRILRAQSLTIERNGLGIPVYEGAKPPDTMAGEELKNWHESERENGLDIATNLRSGDAAGASIPNSANLRLMGVEGKLPDTDGPVRYHDEQIARSVLAHFLNLGTETGSWALGSTFADFFTQSLNSLTKQIQDVTQSHVVEDLVDLNWGPGEEVPRLVVEPIGSTAFDVAAAVKSLVDCGAVTPDEQLEAYLREYYKLPLAEAVPVSAKEG